MEDFDCFTKRQEGAAIEGQYYEFKLVMFITLLAQQNNFRFKVASNMVEAADFDDVAADFEYQDEHGVTKKRTIFLQAKHIKNTEKNKITTLELSECTNKKGTRKPKFGLQKYFNSYLKIKLNKKFFHERCFNVTDCDLIIYTNTHIEYKSNFDLVSCDELLNMLNTGDGKAYKINKGAFNTFKTFLLGNEEDKIEFLQKLVFLTSQSNESELEKLIKCQISEIFDEHCEGDINESFNIASKYIQSWWSENGQVRFLTHNDKYINESSINMTYHKIQNFELDLRVHANTKIIKFKKSTIQLFINEINEHSFCIQIIQKETFLLFTCKILQALDDLDSEGHLIVNESMLDVFSQEILINYAKSQKKNTLIVITSVEQETNFINKNSLIQNLIEIAISHPKKKVVIICTERNMNHIWSLGIGKNHHLLKNSIQLNELSETCCNKVENTEVSFQGKKLKISELFGEFIEQCLDTNTITKALLQIPIEIGRTVDYLKDIWNCYIPRKFTHNAYLDVKSLKNWKNDCFLILSKENDVRNCSYLCNAVNVATKLSFVEHMNVYIYYDEDSVLDIFIKLNAFYTNKNVHLLEYKNEKLLWRKTYGSIESIQHTTTRQVEDKETFSEDDLVTRCNEHQLAIISDIAGMGKTVVLKSLAQHISTKFPYLWVETLDLNKCTNEIEVLGTRNCEFQKYLKYVKQLIIDLITFESESARVTFESLFNIGQVALIFDGFDEIKTSCEESFINIVKALLTLKVRQIYITSRTNKQKYLERMLCTLCYKFIELEEDDQAMFMAQIWMKTKPNKYYAFYKELATRFLRKFNSLKCDNDVSICGIPLQLRMVAEIYKEPTIEVQVIVASETFQANLVEIYEKFVHKKISIANEQRLYASQAQYLLCKEEIVRKHQLFAVHLIFSEHEFLTLLQKEVAQDLYLVLKNKGMQIYGIMMEEGGTNISFVHRTFAEYFSAYYLLNINMNHCSKQLKELFVYSILIDDKYRVLRKFLNQVIQIERDFINPNYHGLAEILWDQKRWYHFNLGYTPLHNAAAENNLYIIEFFIETLLDDHKRRAILVNSKDDKNKTALHVAAENGNLEIVQLLHKLNSSLNNISKNGIPVLVSSAYSGNWQLFDWIRERKINIRIIKPFFPTLVEMARFSGQLEVLSWLVSQGADEKVVQNQNETALHEALKSGNLDLISWYLKRGADINAKNSRGHTVLYESVSMKSWDIVELLLNNNADIDCQDSYSILNSVLHSGNNKILKMCLQRGADINAIDKEGSTLILEATKTNRWEVVIFLIKHEADIYRHCKSNVLLTCKLYFIKWLVYTCSTVHLKDIDQTQEETTNDENTINKIEQYSNITNDYGNSLLHEQVSKKIIDASNVLNKFYVKGVKINDENHNVSNSAIWRWLIKNGADINKRNIWGNTLLHTAARFGEINNVRCLLEMGFSSTDMNNIGNTVLHESVYSNNEELIKFLISEGADIESQNTYGDTVLLLAAARGNIELVKMFTSLGSDLNHINKHGNSALHVASSSNNIELVDWLFSRIEKRYETNIFGITILQIAATNNCIEIVKYYMTKTHFNNPSLELSSLLFSAQSGSLPIIELFYNKTSSYITNKNEKDVFCNAVISGHCNTVHWLLTNCHSLNTSIFEEDYILHYSVLSNNIYMVKFILEKHVNIQEKYTNGDSILHTAVTLGNMDIIQYLVEHGADVKAKNNNGDTILHKAVSFFKYSYLKWLQHIGAQILGIHSFIKIDNEEITKYLEEQGFTVNNEHKYGDRLHHYKTHTKLEEIISYFMNLGLDINCKNNQGLTVLNLTSFVSSVTETCELFPDKNVIVFLIKNYASILENNESFKNSIKKPYENIECYQKNLAYISSVYNKFFYRPPIYFG